MNQRAEPYRERKASRGVLPRSSAAAPIGFGDPSTACGRQGSLGIDAGDVRQIGRGAHDGARNGRAWVEDAKSRNEAAQALGLCGVHFGDHEPVGGLDLPTPKIFVPNLREPMQGVDRHDDLTHHDVMLQDGICDYGVDDAARLGKPAGFEHDAVDCPRGDISPHPIVADVAKQCHKGRPRLTAGAAAPENTQPRRANQQSVIHRRDCGFVDHHQGVLQQAMVKMMAQPRALAGAEKAAENREPHPTFARIARHGVGASSAKRGSSGSTGWPMIRSAASQSSLRVLTIT